MIFKKICPELNLDEEDEGHPDAPLSFKKKNFLLFSLITGNGSHLRLKNQSEDFSFS